tara:strand:+ start:1189 stop:2817 length:1629 start_codon:yes stop_codon:yes gene_type:complete
MKIGLYLRVSTKNQKENTSLQTQQIIGEEFSKISGYEYEIFKDIESGGKYDRIELDRLKEGIKSGELGGIWVYDYDRLSRDIGVGVKISNLIIENKCRLFVRFEEKKLENSGDRFDYNIRSVMSDYERMRIKDRTEGGKKRLINEGGKLGNVGYGFKRKDKLIVVDKKESKLIKDIFKFYNYKVVKSYGDVFKRILKKYGSNKISESSIGRILKDKKYNGLYIGKLEDVEYKIELEKIIEDELWKKTQNKIDDNKGVWRGNRKEFFLLNGKVKCGDCKNRMWVRKSNTYRYYGCNTNIKNVKEKRKGSDVVYYCKSELKGFNKINVEGLEKIIWEGLFKVLNESEDVKSEYKNRFNKGKGSKERFKSNIRHLELKRDGIKEKKINDLSEYIGVLSVDEISKIKEKYDGDVNEIELNIKELKNEEDKKEYNESIDGYLELMRIDLKNEYNINREKDKGRIIKKYIKDVEVLRMESNGNNYEIRLDMFLDNLGKYDNEEIEIKDKGKFYILKITSSQSEYLIYKKFHFKILLQIQHKNIDLKIY